MTTTGRSVLEGAFDLLHFLPETGGEHQLRDLARLSGLPRPTIYRLIGQLHDVGAVEHVDGRWVLGRTVLSLAHEVQPAPGLRHAASSMLRALREQTGGTIALIGKTETSSVILDVVPGREQLPVDIFSGRMLPSHAAASLVLEPSAAPERFNTAQRAAVDEGDVIDGLSCFAVAIPLPDGSAAALQVSMPAKQPARRFSSLAQLGASEIAASLRAS